MNDISACALISHIVNRWYPWIIWCIPRIFVLLPALVRGRRAWVRVANLLWWVKPIYSPQLYIGNSTELDVIRRIDGAKSASVLLYKTWSPMYCYSEAPRFHRFVSVSYGQIDWTLRKGIEGYGMQMSLLSHGKWIAVALRGVEQLRMNGGYSENPGWSWNTLPKIDSEDAQVWLTRFAPRSGLSHPIMEVIHQVETGWRQVKVYKYIEK